MLKKKIANCRSVYISINSITIYIYIYWVGLFGLFEFVWFVWVCFGLFGFVWFVWFCMGLFAFV